MKLFWTADKEQNAFAYAPTETTAEVAWDTFRVGEDQPEVAGIRISLNFDLTELMEKLFTQDERDSMASTRDEESTSGVQLRNLTAGVRYSAEIQGTDQQNNSIPNATLGTSAPTCE